MNKTRRITEGAILVALYIILLLASLYLPILGFFLMFTLSIPFIVYTYRHNFKASLLILTVALTVTYMTVGIMVLPLTLMFGSSGIVMGYLYSKKKEPFPILISGSLAFIVNLVLIYGAAVLFFQMNFAEEAVAMFKESFETAEGLLTKMGQETNNENLESLYEQLEIIPYIIPSAIVLFGVTLTIITQALANRILIRLKANILTFPPFREWRFPQSLLWYYLASMVLMFFGLEEGSSLYIIVLNTFYVLEIVMIVQGLSFIYFYSNKKKWHKSVPITITIIAFFLPFLMYLIRILGIIDLGFDLRKRMVNNGNKE